MTMPVSAVQQRPMNATEWLLLLTLAAIWGGSFYFVAIALPTFQPLTIVFLRCALGALGILIALAMLRQPIPLHKKALIAFVGMGLLNNVLPQTLIAWAQQSLPSGYASILNATTPFFTVLIMHAATTDERASPQKLVGVLIGLGGVATMIGLDILARQSAPLLPQLAILGAAFCYGLSSLWGRRMLGLGIPPFAAAAGQLIAASVILLPLAMVFEQPFSGPAASAAQWTAIIGLGLVCTSLAYMIFFRILSTAGGTNLSLVTLLIPVSAILLGVLFLGETLLPRHIAGFVMIGLGLACIDGRPLLKLGLVKRA